MTTKLEPGTSFQTPTGWTCDAHRGGEIVARFYGEDCAERARKFCEQSNVPTVPACPAGEHTPGEWQTATHAGADFVNVARWNGYQLDGHICTCTGPQRKANSELIARAPALLADNARLIALAAQTALREENTRLRAALRVCSA